jgi:hypothetical protein
MMMERRDGMSDWITVEFSLPDPVNVSMLVKRLVDFGLRGGTGDRCASVNLQRVEYAF